MDYLFYFFLWTFMIYWMHRIVHLVPYVRKIHGDHHAQVSQETIRGLHWSNLFLFFDSWKSTADQWITEVIPTFILCYITGQWWLMIFYYIWAAFIQESIEHNEKFDLYPFITSGRWHLIHHRHPSSNYGVFFPIWDVLFGTWKGIDGNVQELVQK
jgi:sterol desaturase/sphingolipid hydroxylase (fatty acid hydroxylase superfamily)